MGAKNSKFLRDLVQLTTDFIKYMKIKWKQNCEENKEAVTIDVMDCLTELDIYRLDFGALGAFFEKSDFVRKLNGFI